MKKLVLIFATLFLLTSSLHAATKTKIVVKTSADVSVPGKKKSSGEWHMTIIHKTYEQAEQTGLKVCRDVFSNSPKAAAGCAVYSYSQLIDGKWTEPKVIFDQEVNKINKAEAEAEKINIASMIDKAKETCKSLGFKEGTPKFSDCSLKLYTQSVEIAAEQKKSVVMQPQSSGSGVVTIYDPVRDSRALMQQGQRMLSGGCTLGINC